MRKSILLAAYSFIIFFYSCTKDDLGEQLPPETHIGTNTFGCLINGKIWNAKKGSTSVPMLNVDHPHSTVFNLFASRCHASSDRLNSIIEAISFSILQDTVKAGIFVLDDVVKRKGSFSSDLTNCYYESNDNSSNKLELTYFDTVQRIVSGRFELHFAARGNCAALDITNGRFDIKY
ncbi:MAG: hypothetical protein C4329_04195 [Chitinophagaceae bacterium]